MAGFMTFSAIAQESKPATKSTEPPDKEKFGYAMGMHLGQELKHLGVDADASVIAQGVKDVLEGKSTEIKAPEINAILKYAEAAAHNQQTTKNIAEGAAFLAKNAKLPGVTTLPDGLQYRVIKEGTNGLSKNSDVVVLNFRGTWIDGEEFRHETNFESLMWASPTGMNEALQLMKIGSKWQIFVPFELVSAHQKEESAGYGAALIYELELLSAEPVSAHPGHHHGRGRLGHFLDEDFLPPKGLSPDTTP